MSDLKKILQCAREAQGLRAAGAIATVVKVSGSVYRRPGARMLMTADSEFLGGVSGGCLEADVAARAEKVVATNQPVLATYDTRADDDSAWDLGLGCDGMVEVLIETLASREVGRYLEFYFDVLARNGRGVIATVFRSAAAQYPVGKRFLLNEEHLTGNFSGFDGNADLAAQLIDDARRAIAGRQVSTANYQTRAGEIEVVIEPVLRPPRLIICGAGNDAQPLAELAHALDWETLVIDHRAAYANRARFPTADEIIVARGEDYAPASLIVSENDAVVLMTHNYGQDRAWLNYFLGSPAFYVGALGPKRRTATMLRELPANANAENNLLPLTRDERFYAPVGLDIGAETPAEIALSIAAEIRAAQAARNGGNLRARTGAIH